MLEILFSNPGLFLVWLVSLVIAITIHEFSHALMADRLGDPTPRLQGRLTLNPLAHLDPIGTLMLLLVRFGWGKPVQFDPYNLENPRRDAAIISLAGPASNILLATFLAVLVRVGYVFPFSPLAAISTLLLPIIFMNVGLAVFNFIPVHPLDGGKILVGLLPPREALVVERFLQQNSIFILLFLLVTPVISGIVSPITALIIRLLLPSSPII
jgi:Zn-dependent protease